MQRCDDIVAQRLHAGRADLADQVIAIAIHHQARQPVRVAEHQTVVRQGKIALAQGQRDLHAVYQQGHIDGVLRVAADDARTDQ